MNNDNSPPERRLVEKFLLRRKKINEVSKRFGYAMWTEQKFKIIRKGKFIERWLPIEWGDHRYTKIEYRYSTVHKKVVKCREKVPDFPMISGMEYKFTK